MHPLNPILASAVLEQVEADRRAAAAPRRTRLARLRRRG